MNWYDSLIKQMGHTKALALITALGNNDPVLVESHTEALTDVQSGEPAGAESAGAAPSEPEPAVTKAAADATGDVTADTTQEADA